MTYVRKQLLARVSTAAGSFVKAWTNIQFNGYTKTLNGGPSECVITYNVAFDYSGADLREGNDVELVISDTDTLGQDENGLPYGMTRTIYKGYISLIERDLDGANENVTIHLLGYYTLLALDVLKDSDQSTMYSNTTTGLTTTGASNNAADVGLMMRAVIDQYISETGSTKIRYNSTVDIPDTSTTAKYIFQQKTYREAIDTLKTLAPEDVYWYFDEVGNFTFKAIPTTPTHTFIFGRHFSKVHLEKSLEKLRNFVLIYNGDSSGSGVYNHYQDDASIAAYGRRAERITDLGIKDTGAANQAGAKFLAENKEPALRLVCTIFDNNNVAGLGADIEDINPGDTCRLVGFSSDLSDIFRDNMLITEVRYALESVEITIELVRSGLIDTQAKQGRQITDITSGGLDIPESYT